MVTAAYPYVNVKIDTSGLAMTAARATGNVAIVGDAEGHGTLAGTPNAPRLISSIADARKYFATLNSAGAVTGSGKLYTAVETALLQNPAPARVYAVVASATGSSVDYASALASLESVSVQIVCLAGETDAGVAGPPATNLLALKDHVENTSADGSKRIGVAWVDPTLTPTGTQTYTEAVSAKYGSLISSDSRMVLVAGRTSTGDLAAATAGAIGGYDPQISVLLKPVANVTIALEDQFGPSDIKELSEAFVIPVIDPDLIPGSGFYLGAGRTYTSDTELLYVDIVRVLDDIEFRLKAGLIGSIGNVRIDRLGMETLSSRIDAVLGPLKRRRVIDDYSAYVPLLPSLAKAEAARSADEKTEITNARLARTVDVFISVWYGPAIHVLNFNVALKA